MNDEMQLRVDVLPVPAVDATWLATLALGLAALGAFYVYSTWTYDTFTKQGIPGPKPLPLIGNLKDLLFKEYAEWQMAYAKQFGSMYGIYIGRRPALVIADPELLKDVAVKQFHSFTNRWSPYSTQKPVDRMLVFLTDDHWKHVRAALSPVFTTGKLKEMMSTITKCGDALVMHLSKREGQEVDVKTMTSAFTLDVIMGTAFGIDAQSFEDPNKELLRSALGAFDFINKKSIAVVAATALTMLSGTSLHFLHKLGLTISNFKAIGFIESILRPSLKAGQSNSSKKNFAEMCSDQLVEIENVPKATIHATKNVTWTSAGLLADDIISNAIVFALAGYETTASLLAVFFYSMAKNPHVQERLYQELCKSCYKGAAANYETVNDVAYLDWCIDETLRMYPPTVAMTRVCGKSTNVGGVSFTAGMLAYFPIFAIHHDPALWPEPDKFRPERFSPDEKHNRPAGTHIPFGFGPRMCIGMRLALLEAKVAIAKVLSAYAIETCNGTPKEPLRWKSGVVLLSPRDRIFLKFVQRHQ